MRIPNTAQHMHAEAVGSQVRRPGSNWRVKGLAQWPPVVSLEGGGSSSSGLAWFRAAGHCPFSVLVMAQVSPGPPLQVFFSAGSEICTGDHLMGDRPNTQAHHLSRAQVIPQMTFMENCFTIWVFVKTF